MTFGQGGGGKTTSMNALVNSEEVAEMTSVNIFIVYFYEDGTAEMEPTDESQKDKSKAVRVTDTAGQEDYNEMRTLAYKYSIAII